jgi:hypothetical protein
MEVNTWIDPIVDEVRAAREELFREADYDLGRMHDRIMRSQERHHERLVRAPARPVSDNAPPSPPHAPTDIPAQGS